MTRRKPKLDGLVFDLANMRTHRPRVYGYWPPRVGVARKSVKIVPTVPPQVATIPNDLTRRTDGWPTGPEDSSGFSAQ